MASIGGLDASLCKEASAAFVQTLTAADPGSLAAPPASYTDLALKLTFSIMAFFLLCSHHLFSKYGRVCE